MPGAHDMLATAWRGRRSLFSVGLEPCPEYLPASGEFAPTIEGYERWLMAVAEASAPFAAAYKFNLAFFEALGPEGWALLKRVRDRLPAGVMVIADAKRGDIGSTAKRYAQATFEWLNADSVTLSPLMGRDSAEPFLAYANKVCFFLCLTSNPGSKDFLQRNGLSLDIARAVSSWGSAQQCGLVVGATQAGRVAEIRAAAPGATFLIPGVGAQGGDAEAVAREGLSGFTGETPPLLFHVTRGLFPEKSDTGTFAEVVRRKSASYRDLFASAVDTAMCRTPSPKEAAHA
jgi:orotidine-5'-phosphate decarboxylase